MNDKDIPKEVRARIETLFEQAGKQLAKQGGVAPVVVVIGDELAMVDAAANTEQEKDRVAFMVRELVKIHNARMVVHVGEFWTLPEDMPEQKMKELALKYRFVEDMPGRVERVVIKVETTEGGQWVGLAPILRAGRRVSLGKVSIHSSVGLGGRYQGYFAEALPMPTPEEFAAFTDRKFH